MVMWSQPQFHQYFIFSMPIHQYSKFVPYDINNYVNFKKGIGIKRYTQFNTVTLIYEKST